MQATPSVVVAGGGWDGGLNRRAFEWRSAKWGNKEPWNDGRYTLPSKYGSALDIGLTLVTLKFDFWFLSLQKAHREPLVF